MPSMSFYLFFFYLSLFKNKYLKKKKTLPRIFNYWTFFKKKKEPISRIVTMNDPTDLRNK